MNEEEIRAYEQGIFRELLKENNELKTKICELEERLKYIGDLSKGLLNKELVKMCRRNE
jgi:hypothetical protein